MNMRLDTSVPDLTEQIDGYMPTLSSVLEITVKNESADAATRLADQVSVSASGQILNTVPYQAGRSPSIVVYTLGSAVANTRETRANLLLAIILGGILGVVLVSPIALAIEKRIES